jgi:ABC-type transport system substrate-binding protein
MSESNYWDKFMRRGRLSRRQLLHGTALTGGGLAVAAMVGCSSAEPGTTGTGGPGTTGDDPLSSLDGEAVSPNDGRREFVYPQDDSGRGGTLVYIGFDPVVLDRYDPHQTQFGPMYANQSAIFSKLYHYASHEEPTWENIVPDLAESAPEIIGDPPMTYVVKLRKGVKFHDTEQIRKDFPGLAGRELTADDVIYSYERQQSTTSPQKAYYYRKSQYNTIDKMEKLDDYTIRFTTKEPTAPFYHFMADTNAMIIPKEIVDMEPGPDGKPWDSVDAFGSREPRPAARMIGTGPFMWDTLKFGIEFIAARNPEWFGWDDPDLGRPFMDGYKATGQGLNDPTIESLFRRKEIDVAGFIDNPQWMVDFKNEHPEVEYQRQQVSGWIGTRFKTYCKPFDDPRVRRALHLAIDRREVVDVIGSGAWVKVGPVGSAIKFWALPQEELEGLPGYRTDPAERTQDITEARQLYEAAGRPALPQIWFADVPAYIPRFAQTYLQTIKNNLGLDEVPKYLTVPYQRIAEGYAREECDQAAMSWGFDNGWIDLDDWVYPYFKTDGPKNSFKVSDPKLDTMLDAQRREFDIDARRAIGYDIQRYLLGLTDPVATAAHVRLDYATPGGGSISWPYLKNRVSYPWFGNSQWSSNVWIDQNDPSYSGRPG